MITEMKIFFEERDLTRYFFRNNLMNQHFIKLIKNLYGNQEISRNLIITQDYEGRNISCGIEIENEESSINYYSWVKNQNFKGESKKQPEEISQTRALERLIFAQVSGARLIPISKLDISFNSKFGSITQDENSQDQYDGDEEILDYVIG